MLDFICAQTVWSHYSGRSALLGTMLLFWRADPYLLLPANHGPPEQQLAV
jgi:hypothetical protein